MSNTSFEESVGCNNDGYTYVYSSFTHEIVHVVQYDINQTIIKTLPKRLNIILDIHMAEG